MDSEAARLLLLSYVYALVGAVKDLWADPAAFLFPADNRAQAGNLASLIIGLTIAAVIAISVAIPVINNVIADSNVTGTTSTILNLLDLFISLLLLVAIASPLMRRT